MSLFKSNPSENGSTETFSPFTKFQEAFAPKMALVKSNVIYNQFLIEPIKNPSTDVDTEGLVCESSLHLEAPNTNENAVFIWIHFEGTFSDTHKTLTFSLAQKFKINRSWTEVEQVDDALKPYLYSDIYETFVMFFNTAFPDVKLIVAKTNSGIEIRAALSDAD